LSFRNIESKEKTTCNRI